MLKVLQVITFVQYWIKITLERQKYLVTVYNKLL